MPTPASHLPRRTALRRAATLAAPLLAAFVAGCSTDPANQFPPQCPALSLVQAGGEITKFAGAGRDASDMVLHARITAVPAECERSGSTTVKSTLTVTGSLSRGPAAKGAAPPVTYFVAVLEGDRILQQQDFTLAAEFPPNVDKSSFKSDDIELLTPVSKEKSAAAYHIYVGFRLTPEELAYNRSHPDQ